jgi:hypothetical protein
VRKLLSPSDFLSLKAVSLCFMGRFSPLAMQLDEWNLIIIFIYTHYGVFKERDEKNKKE